MRNIFFTFLFGLAFNLLNGQTLSPHTVSMDAGDDNSTAFTASGLIGTDAITYHAHWDLTYLYLGFLYKKEKLLYNKMSWIWSLIGLEIITGIAMTYFKFPFGTQTSHLVFASILFGVQFYIILETYKNKDDLQIQNNS